MFNSQCPWPTLRQDEIIYTWAKSGLLIQVISDAIQSGEISSSSPGVYKGTGFCGVLSVEREAAIFGELCAPLVKHTFPLLDRLTNALILLTQPRTDHETGQTDRQTRSVATETAAARISSTAEFVLGEQEVMSFVSQASTHCTGRLEKQKHK